MTLNEPDATASLQQEIDNLEQRLQDAQARLRAHSQANHVASPSATPLHHSPSSLPLSYLHPLLLLSDSALPLGSFAFSSGLESFLAHRSKRSHTPALFSRFISLSLASLASTTLPYVITGYLSPEELEDLDNDLDASTTCTVARRASVQQGRALVAVWERSFRAHLSSTVTSAPAHSARVAIEAFAVLLKAQAPRHDDGFGGFAPNGHLPPLFGTLCAALSIPLRDTLYLYLLNHAKALVSAAIRASVLGPYQAQGVLASEGLQGRIWGIVAEELGPDGWKNARGTDEAGQSVPAMDLWGGRHEIIYSRIFNS